MNELTIVTPVYNEAGNITTAINRIEAEVTVPHEIYVVYDMDEDTTVPVVREIAGFGSGGTSAENKSNWRQMVHTILWIRR